MIDFYQLVQEIKKRPTLYLGRASIFDFQSFYHGYILARNQLGLPKTIEEKEFEEFLEWIRSIYPVKTRQSWANIVLFHSADERDALNKLFELFEDFRNRDKNNLKNDGESLDKFFQILGELQSVNSAQ